MRHPTWLIVGLLLIVVAVVGIAVTSLLAARQSRASLAAARFGSEGQRIYLTGAGPSGRPIPFTGGPHWFQMHDGGCVVCHGPQGTGGAVPMTGEVAPDIRYRALTAEHHEAARGEEHPAYTDALIARAMTQGVDPAGQPLSQAMPRWRMSDREVSEVIAYLKTLRGAPSQ